MTRTLADMTPQEREDCRGMWCDYTDPAEKHFRVIYRHDKNGLSSVQDPKKTDGSTDTWVMTRCLIPRFDLPRAWGADGEPVKGKWQEGGPTVWNLADISPFTACDFTHRRFVHDWEAKP